MRFLIVGDYLRDAAASCLLELGHEVDHVATEREAIAKVETQAFDVFVPQSWMKQHSAESLVMVLRTRWGRSGDQTL